MVGSKLKAIKTCCTEGEEHASKKEAARCNELQLMQRGKLIKELMTQPRFRLEVNGQKVCDYVADFMYLEYQRKDKWERIIEDVKGYKKGTAYAIFRIKKKLMRACLGIDVRET